MSIDGAKKYTMHEQGEHCYSYCQKVNVSTSSSVQYEKEYNTK